MPTEQPPLVGKVGDKFCGQKGVSWSARRIPKANFSFPDRKNKSSEVELDLFVISLGLYKHEDLFPQPCEGRLFYVFENKGPDLSTLFLLRSNGKWRKLRKEEFLKFVIFTLYSWSRMRRA
jgi:hypothetical protein